MSGHVNFCSKGGKGEGGGEGGGGGRGGGGFRKRRGMEEEEEENSLAGGRVLLFATKNLNWYNRLLSELLEIGKMLSCLLSTIRICIS